MSALSAPPIPPAAAEQLGAVEIEKETADAPGRDANTALTMHREDLGVIVIEPHPELFAYGTSTGWVTWNASFVLCEYLQQHPEIVAGRCVADVSSGNGLVAMCCAKLGAEHVLATEVEECTALTRRNVHLNALEDAVTVVSYYWGALPCPVLSLPASAGVSEVATTQRQPCSVVFFTDLLYIAIRDSLEDELLETLRYVCCRDDDGQPSPGIKSTRALFAFEERALDEEAAFMARIAEGNEGLCCEEIDSEHFDLSVIQPEGEFAALLWEPPSMRFFWLQQR